MDPRCGRRWRAAHAAAFGVLASGNPWNVASVRALDAALAEAGGVIRRPLGSVIVVRSLLVPAGTHS